MSSTHKLEVNPDTQLEFVLSHSEATPRCIMTLKHPGTSDDHLAFKVRAHVELWYFSTQMLESSGIAFSCRCRCRCRSLCRCRCRSNSRSHLI
jgi:hypothetical protein